MCGLKLGVWSVAPKARYHKISIRWAMIYVGRELLCKVEDPLHRTQFLMSIDCVGNKLWRPPIAFIAI